MTLADALICELHRLSRTSSDLISATKLVRNLAAEREVAEAHLDRVLVGLLAEGSAEMVDDHHVMLTAKGWDRARDFAGLPPIPKKG